MARVHSLLFPAVALVLALPFSACAQAPSAEPPARAAKPEAVPPGRAVLRVASYNIENLFDTADDPLFEDEEFLPNSPKQWTPERYRAKLVALARVIDSLRPDVLGIVEAENTAVLRDLLTQLGWQDSWGIVHYDSRYHRGADVALLYRKAVFAPIETRAIPFFQEGKGFSRDFLWVKGRLPSGDSLTLVVNHWPSRKNPPIERLNAANAIRRHTDSVLAAQPFAAVLLVGDFNDTPYDESLKDGLGAGALGSAAMWKLHSLTTEPYLKDQGSYCFKDRWEMIDNAVASWGITGSRCRVCYRRQSMQVYGPDWMRQGEPPQFARYPNRTYVGDRYLGGPSDHFPILLELTYPAP